MALSGEEIRGHKQSDGQADRQTETDEIVCERRGCFDSVIIQLVGSQGRAFLQSAVVRLHRLYSGCRCRSRSRTQSTNSYYLWLTYCVLQHLQWSVNTSLNAKWWEPTKQDLQQLDADAAWYPDWNPTIQHVVLQDGDSDMWRMSTELPGTNSIVAMAIWVTVPLMI